MGLERMHQDAQQKAFFAGSPMDNNPPSLYIKSTWQPPAGSVPQELDDLLSQGYLRHLQTNESTVKSTTLSTQDSILVEETSPLVPSGKYRQRFRTMYITIPFTSYVNYCLKSL